MSECITFWKTTPAMLTGERNHDAIAVKKQEDEIPRWPNSGKAEAVR